MAIKLTIVLLIIHYIGYFITKNNKVGVLSCGLFGWAGKNIKDFNSSLFNTLGILNEVRGEHSCGVATDGEIYNGVDDTKIYRNFLAKSGYKKPTTLPVVIGHTRHSTMGGHSIDNAHPFGFGYNSKVDGFQFIGAHNGTIHNHKEFGPDFGVNVQKKITKNKTEVNADKIDSEILLESIYKSKNFKVLSQYQGAAALLFTNVNEPNVIYAYHGASKKYSAATTDEIFVERPLFYYQQSKNSVYISSLESSLLAIGGTKDNVGEFDCNVVYKIKDGNISKATRTVITRAGRAQNKITYSVNRRSNYGRRSNNSSVIPINRHSQTRLPIGRTGNNTNDSIYNIHNENIIKGNINNYKSTIYFNKFRYWRNGHLISGCYVFIKGYGFLKMGESVNESIDAFKKNLDVPFNSETGLFLKNLKSKDAFIPFPKSKYKTANPDTYLHYMYQGINISLAMDYTVTLNNIGTSHEFDWDHLSCCSVHPIIDIYKGKHVLDDKQGILKDYDLFNGTISPLGSDRIYTIEGGNCIEYKSKYYNKPESNQDNNDYLQLDTVVKELEENENALTEGERGDLLNKTIEEIFNTPFKTFPLGIKRLLEFKDLEKGAKALEILEKFITTTNNLIAIEEAE